jgi:hypothetical protein
LDDLCAAAKYGAIRFRHGDHGEPPAEKPSQEQILPRGG